MEYNLFKMMFSAQSEIKYLETKELLSLVTTKHGDGIALREELKHAKNCEKFSVISYRFTKLK